jgi:hypothetical protein
VLRIASVVVALCACGGKSDDKPKADPKGSGSGSTVAVEPGKPAAGLDKLVVTVNGKAVAMQRAFVKRVSADQYRLQVGDLEGSCDELLSGVTNAKPGATSFVATLAKHLAPDGVESMVITDFWSAGHPTKAALGGLAKLTGTPTKTATVEIELPKITDVDSGKTIIVSGPLTATGCGDQPDTGVGVPKGQHVSAAYVTIAGRKLELRGAILRGSDVLLSASPKDCSAVTPFAPVVIQHENGKWEISGTWIGEQKTASTDTMKGAKFAVGAAAKTGDGPTVALALSGAGSIAGYPLKFEGTIEALDCPTK